MAVIVRPRKNVRASARWTIKEVDGEFETYEGGRRRRTFINFDTAERWLRSRVDTKNGDTVTRIEQDGYRVDITRRFIR